jgi:hypothetical protein
MPYLTENLHLIKLRVCTSICKTVLQQSIPMLRKMNLSNHLNNLDYYLARGKHCSTATKLINRRE